MHYVYLIEPGRRPPFPEVAYHLWGPGCHFDSDGNDDQLPADGWTELTVMLRPAYEERVDIDPLDDDEPLVLVIRSERKNLAEKAGLFLKSSCGGELSSTRPARTE